jgi:hypothetical protein
LVMFITLGNKLNKGNNTWMRIGVGM